MKSPLEQLAEENLRLREIIRVHDLCHDLHGKVGPCEFAEGCAREQRKLFGWAYHADAVRILWRGMFALIALNIISWIIIGAIV